MENKDITTGEIMRALRFCGDDNTTCVECVYTSINADGGCFSELSNIAADRLESQEWEIERLRGQIDLQGRICKVCDQELTARAEQAEKAILEIHRMTFPTNFQAKTADDRTLVFESCLMRDIQKIIDKWRGQPQEGEGLK